MGAIGCVIISPPVFISEASARLIIEDEFSRENLFFDNNDVEINDEKLRGFIINAGERAMGIGRKLPVENQDNEPKPLKIDGFNEKLNLGYIYISRDDFDDLVEIRGSGFINCWATRELAMYMQERMDGIKKINFVVFYDPVAHVDLNVPEDDFIDSKIEKIKAIKESKKRSEQLLRKQVRDFIEWAKHEGVFDRTKKKITADER